MMISRARAATCSWWVRINYGFRQSCRIVSKHTVRLWRQSNRDHVKYCHTFEHSKLSSHYFSYTTNTNRNLTDRQIYCVVSLRRCCRSIILMVIRGSHNSCALCCSWACGSTVSVYVCDSFNVAESLRHFNRVPQSAPEHMYVITENNTPSTKCLCVCGKISMIFAAHTRQTNST